MLTYHGEIRRTGREEGGKINKLFFLKKKGLPSTFVERSGMDERTDGWMQLLQRA